MSSENVLSHIAKERRKYSTYTKRQTIWNWLTFENNILLILRSCGADNFRFKQHLTAKKELIHFINKYIIKNIKVQFTSGEATSIVTKPDYFENRLWNI